MSRYKQNHEWMEEILSSPYSINQIIPADLGLGVRGELAGLTEGFFDAPIDPDKDVAKYNYVGRLDPGKADEFRNRATERIAEVNKEIEKMKTRHAKRLANSRKVPSSCSPRKSSGTPLPIHLILGPNTGVWKARLMRMTMEMARSPAKFLQKSMIFSQKLKHPSVVMQFS